jgi:hypothetical protein
VDNIFTWNSQGGSQFWRSLHKINHLFKLGAKFLPGSGWGSSFWLIGGMGRGPWQSDSHISLTFVALNLFRLLRLCLFHLQLFNSDALSG